MDKLIEKFARKTQDPRPTSRRSFLKLTGRLSVLAGAAAAGVAGLSQTRKASAWGCDERKFEDCFTPRWRWCVQDYTVPCRGPNVPAGCHDQVLPQDTQSYINCVNAAGNTCRYYAGCVSEEVEILEY